MFEFDWGGEYRSLTSFHGQYGIMFRQSSPYTSEQDGILEWKHRHIVETGLTLLAHSGLPFKYWGEAFSAAIYLINRLPTPVLHHQYPFEALSH